MLKLGKQIETSLIALKSLEMNPKGLSISDIAMSHKLSKNSLSKILQNLVNQGILVSTQGLKGGYTLIKPTKEINFYDLLVALDELKPLTCLTKAGCESEDHCSIKSPLKEWDKRFSKFLTETCVEDLIFSEEEKSNLLTSNKEPLKTQMPAEHLSL